MIPSSRRISLRAPTLTLVPLAHLGHWYWVLIFMIPALLVLGGAIWMALQERGKAREGRELEDD